MIEKLNTQLPDRLEIECRCVPSSPFYVRWLNRFGGIDYWMFEKRQTWQRKQNNIEDFEPYIADFSDSTGTNYVFSKEISEEVIVGADLLTPNEWYEISRILYSPTIQWYDERRAIWIDIMVEKGDVSRFTDAPAHSLEITFLLPQPQLQF